jgi:hypothetical protein
MAGTGGKHRLLQCRGRAEDHSQHRDSQDNYPRQGDGQGASQRRGACRNGTESRR